MQVLVFRLPMKYIKTFSLTLASLISATSIAQTGQRRLTDVPCATDKVAYARICSDTESREPLPANHPSGFYYKWELDLLLLAGVDYTKDSDEIMTAKIKRFLNTCAKYIICDSINLKKYDIDYFRLLVAIGATDVTNKAIELWGWPLNDIKDNDGKSVLDYVYDEYVYYKKGDANSGRAKELKKLYKLCKANGATHYKVAPVDLSIIQ